MTNMNQFYTDMYKARHYKRNTLKDCLTARDKKFLVGIAILMALSAGFVTGLVVGVDKGYEIRQEITE